MGKNINNADKIFPTLRNKFLSFATQKYLFMPILTNLRHEKWTLVKDILHK